MAAGPKKAITAEALSFKGYPRDRAGRRLRFIRDYLVIPKGVGAGKPVKLRDFQQEIVRGAFAPGVLQALVSCPRGQGKTGLAAMLALAEMFVGPASAEVLVVASDQRQAMLTYKIAKRMVELNPALSERIQVFSDRLYLPENDASLIPLPAEPGALHGYDPSLLIVDELHVVTEAVWEAVTSAAGKRPESLTLAISTPAADKESIMWRLVQHGRAGEDPQFYFKEYAAPEGCDVMDRDAWRIANPALACKDPFLTEAGIEAVMKTLREPAARQLRLGQWVTGVNSWLPFGLFESRADPQKIVPDKQRVTLGFDGSASGDSTALIACTVEEKPHLFVIGLWENPGDPNWRVPRQEVTDHVDMAFSQFDVVELNADPWGWRSELEQWQKKHGEKRVLEYNTAHRVRMAPATDRLYQLLTTEGITHDGDSRLTRHFSNCVAIQSTMGAVVSKDKKHSPRKIDAAVAAIAAADRAVWHSTKTKKKRAYAF
ncbi:terminase large subunit [Arthrobacter sp. EH-1B-1]|uniref:Terminase large subunit n=1 Tax=Arthrobacter vasquezii TaxID=2977629 RepID=A0ABT6CZ87_9MICC|nr:terminase large subunit [Arthrobacter vasquezii]MDF9279423.1 terminase large subunit [Arthrobacter vasquezii]